MSKCKKIFYQLMNSSVLNKFTIHNSRFTIHALCIVHCALCIFLFSCKKDKNYVYEVKDVVVKQPGSDKSHVKTTTEFISIVYSDLFNATVPTDTLVVIQTAYDAFGDKKLIEDMIVRHFL